MNERARIVDPTTNVMLYERRKQPTRVILYDRCTQQILCCMTGVRNTCYVVRQMYTTNVMLVYPTNAILYRTGVRNKC